MHFGRNLQPSWYWRAHEMDESKTDSLTHQRPFFCPTLRLAVRFEVENGLMQGATSFLLQKNCQIMTYLAGFDLLLSFGMKWSRSAKAACMLVKLLAIPYKCQIVVCGSLVLKCWRLNKKKESVFLFLGLRASSHARPFSKLFLYNCNLFAM